MTLVVDASVAVKWMLREPGNEAARALLRIPDPLIAPDWLLAEAANAMWKKVKRSELLEVHAERHLEELPDYFSRLYPSSGLLKEAFRLSFRLRHPVYDCVYLALARRVVCKFVTADVKFYNRLVSAGATDEVLLLEYDRP